MKIRIKTWETMVKEYGLDIDGDIFPEDCEECFTQDMKEFCGEEVEILKITKNGSKKAIAIDNEYESWIIKPFMIEENDLDKFLTFLYK